MSVKDFIQFELFTIGTIHFRVINLVVFVLIYLIIRLSLYFLKLYFRKLIVQNRLESGKAHALYQILVYLIYVIGIVLAIETTGAKITVLIAGSTAILVGIGLGLQDFFKDIVAGLILLFERAIAVGDVIEVNGMVCKVQEIGLRATIVNTLDDIAVVIPNTKLTNFPIINWSQNQIPTRFNITVTAEYGSDTALVKKLLLQAAKSHPDVLDEPHPRVMLIDFGARGLVFDLFFYSNNLFGIPMVKSQIRFEIDKLFRKYNLRFAIPQNDVYLHSPTSKP
ncbi:MAG: mechanosensitive ion channel family protein [Thermaurantimonas sp.]|uniref:mechanosensitive ion channel family protein n=1 Tax=Thermaurantimonas sp. TaxID=2681568 RepID=UPI003919AFE8